MNPDYEVREYFLAVLLKEISRHLSGRPFAVKGGICLHFFHQSPRLSEDMDLDIAQVSPNTLRNIVEKIMISRSLNEIMENRGLRLSKWNASKQTPTTQRWKIGLLINNRTLSTRLEFSRRKKELQYVSGIPDAELLSHYKIMAFVAQYYSIEDMIIQKIMALASPAREAPRDMYDLYFLIGRYKKGRVELPARMIGEALDKCRAIDLAAFRNQVAPFLPGDLASFFAKPENYHGMRDGVISFLLKGS